MEHILAALILLAVASHAHAGITDNFLEDPLLGRGPESLFQANIIRELARQGTPISEEMIGGGFQFTENIAWNTVDVEYGTISNTGETLYKVPLIAPKSDYLRLFAWYPDYPGHVSCGFWIKMPKDSTPRNSFVKGDIFIIEKVQVTCTESGEVSHFFTLSEAERTPQGIKAIPGKEMKSAIKCVAPIRLKQWSLIAGLIWIYPFISKEMREVIADTPLADVPSTSAGSHNEPGRPRTLMERCVAMGWPAWLRDVSAGGESLDTAIAKYTAGIEANPKDAWSHWKRANAYRKKKEFASAMRDLGEVIRLAEAEKDAGAFAIQMRNTRAVWRIKELSSSSK